MINSPNSEGNMNDTFFLNNLTQRLQEAIAQCKVEWGDIGLLTSKNSHQFNTSQKKLKIWFILQERPLQPIYLEIIKTQKEQFFKTETGQDAFGYPISIFNEPLGLVVCAGDKRVITNKNTGKLFAHLGILTEHFLLNQRIRQISLDRWGDPIVFIGFNSIIMAQRQKLRMFAKSDKPVLITGETGVGKEVFAKLCHLWSPRENGPFYSVNCGQFQNENLMVSELFGHKKGSFTGAVEDHKGVFEMAHGGTIFLDEIGELSPDAQKMLLRVLDKKEIKPLGSRQVIKVDVRVVSATHRDLLKMVSQRLFREDLFHRLSTFEVDIPPLRERGEDCGLLIDYYLEELNKKHGVRKELSQDALDYLKSYSFPGNIRELKNIVETAFWMSPANIIELPDVTIKTKAVRLIEQKQEPTLQEAFNLFTRYLEQQNKLIESLMNNRNSQVVNGEAISDNQHLSSNVQECYKKMVDEGQNFWDVVKEPFLNRDLNREEVQAIIKLGLDRENGSRKRLSRLFNVSDESAKTFYDFLYRNDLLKKQ